MAEASGLVVRVERATWVGTAVDSGVDAIVGIGVGSDVVVGLGVEEEPHATVIVACSSIKPGTRHHLMFFMADLLRRKIKCMSRR